MDSLLGLLFLFSTTPSHICCQVPSSIYKTELQIIQVIKLSWDAFLSSVLKAMWLVKSSYIQVMPTLLLKGKQSKISYSHKLHLECVQVKGKPVHYIAHSVPLVGVWPASQEGISQRHNRNVILIE